MHAIRRLCCLIVHMLLLNVILLFTGKPYKKISIQKEPNRTYYEPGSNVKLTCDVGNDTFYSIGWYKRNFLGNFEAIKSIFHGSGSFTLDLNSLYAHDLGTYACVVFRSPLYYNSVSTTIQFKGSVQLRSCQELLFL